MTRIARNAGRYCSNKEKKKKVLFVFFVGSPVIGTRLPSVLHL